MIKYYKISNRQIAESTHHDAQVVVYICQDESERQVAIEQLGLDAHDVESALDPDEISRIEYYEEGRTFIIWKEALQARFDESLRFDVLSVGIFLEPNRISFVTSGDIIYFSPREYKGIESPADVFLRYLQATTRHYLEHLKGIKLITGEIQSKINTSMENKYLLQMFALSESLVYYMNAIESNELVMTKLNVNQKKLALTEDQQELLDDIRLDNQQCSRQAQTYSTVLSGLMDARGNIINNNMNLLLRDLTLLNVIFLPLNLIASIGGMSEYSMMTKALDWRVSYALFFVGMIALGVVTWMILTRLLRRRH